MWLRDCDTGSTIRGRQPRLQPPPHLLLLLLLRSAASFRLHALPPGQRGIVLALASRTRSGLVVTHIIVAVSVIVAALVIIVVVVVAAVVVVGPTIVVVVALVVAVIVATGAVVIPTVAWRSVAALVVIVVVAAAANHPSLADHCVGLFRQNALELAGQTCVVTCTSVVVVVLRFAIDASLVVVVVGVVIIGVVIVAICGKEG